MELIDKNALVKYLEGMGNEIYAGNDEYFIGQKAGLMKVVGVVMTFPAVEERKQGCWKNGCCTVCGESAATDGHFDFIPEEEQKYCCTFCRWQYGDIEPDCENCDPMDN